MLFNSYVFIFIFLPTTLVVFYTLGRLRWAKGAVAALTLASLFFYGYWNPPYLILLVGSIVANYFMGRLLSRPASLNRKVLLGAGITFNLLLIGYYKYAAFLLGSILPSGLYNSVDSALSLGDIFLPLGISFFTFQQIAYLVDAYQGQTKDYGFMDYCLFVSFFPQLIAGPIVHHKEVLPQFYQPETFQFSHRSLALGLTTFILGLSKKVLIADNISPWVGTVFSHAADVSFIEAWVGALSYTLQLYFDFSGYSDMAIGLGLMLNIQLPLNFNSPYKATSIVDFWRRWHITLSNFLRDYLYIPLGGSRRGDLRRYGNLMATMLLGGLWHGAGWTFVLWGGLHGAFLSVNHLWRKLPIKLPHVLSWGLTFVAVMLSWVLFRATTLGDASALLGTMAGFNGVVIPGEAAGKLGVLTKVGIELRSWSDLTYLPVLNGNKLLAMLALIGLVGACAGLPNTQQIVERLRPRWYWAMGIGGLSVFCLLSLSRVSEFLYFQF
ncbi:MAG: MBOAT family protein [Cyanobacteria bacterium P01_A01_bin.105]